MPHVDMAIVLAAAAAELDAGRDPFHPAFRDQHLLTYAEGEEMRLLVAIAIRLFLSRMTEADDG